MDNEKEIVHGYEIKEAVIFTNNRGFARGENPNAPQPFVTWQFTEENGKRDYYWGHYSDKEYLADNDFHTRVNEYQAQYGVAARSVFPEKEIYNYFSTQRPVDIGTFPKESGEPLSFVNFGERLSVEDGAFRAWGILTYSAPLTEKQIADYELRAARDNPDRQRTKLPIAAQLAEATKQAARNNATRPDPSKDTGKER